MNIHFVDIDGYMTGMFCKQSSLLIVRVKLAAIRLVYKHGMSPVLSVIYKPICPAPVGWPQSDRSRGKKWF